jgi:hypothetical protein
LQIEIREFAIQMALLVYKNTWGMPDDVRSPTNISVQQGPFNPDENGYESFIVSWDQVVFVGEAVWGPVPLDIAKILTFDLDNDPDQVIVQ